jgi:excisionase family DNA binding protein
VDISDLSIEQIERHSPRYWTAQQVAMAACCGRMTIIRALDAGRFPGAWRLGGGVGSRWRIPRSDVAAFLRGEL